MDCREVKQVVDQYLDRELSVEAAADLERHLAECPACRREHGALIDFLGSNLPVRVPAGLGDRILGTVLRSRDERSVIGKGKSGWVTWASLLVRARYFASQARRLNKGRVFWPAVAAAVVLLVLGWWVWPVEKRRPAMTAKRSTPEVSVPANPWVLSSLAQNFITTGMAAPLVTVVQSSMMERLAAGPVDEPQGLAYVRYRPRIQGLSAPEVRLPTLDFALFSSVFKF